MGDPGTIRIMTYNVHSCTGTDGRTSTYRIAEVIARYEPDVVALQELDVLRARTGMVHQAEEIAGHLDMDFHFHPSMEIQEEQFGNAILSRFHMKLVRAGALPGFRTWRGGHTEKRGAMWASIRPGGRDLQVINTHLGLSRRERMLQAQCLLGRQWSAHSECSPPLIVCGDFNALPVSRVYGSFSAFFMDAQLSVKGMRPRGTYPSRYPLARIDHIFTSREVRVEDIQVPNTRLTRSASDHLPLIIDVSI